MTAGPILCAHSDAGGKGAHWLQSSERCPGACPGSVEGSGRPGAVVGDQLDGDHAEPGGAPGDTLSVGALTHLLARLRWDTPVRLEILGDVIDLDGVAIYEGEIRLVGAEVVV